MLADEPTLLSPSEVAAELEVSPTSIRRWIRDGRLRAIRLPSGQRKVRRVDVEAILRGDDDATATVAAS
jgi:excisionase family DNA binding protein